MRCILTLFLTYFIGFDEDTATVIYHAFTVCAYSARFGIKGKSGPPFILNFHSKFLHFFPLLGAAIADGWWRAGIHHIVALRGDMPSADVPYAPHPEGYTNAADLVTGLRDRAGFEISVAAYPECHPDSPTAKADLDNLKRKVDAGATQAITQYFFDNDDFLRFRDRIAAAGIEIPVIPGILPVTNFAKVVEFSARCGATVPDWMAKLFEGLDDDPDTRKLVAVSVAVDQCRALQTEGVPAFHFYTLNRAELTYAICWRLGLRPLDAAA